MANCFTCKHNDRRAKMCTLQDVHTDFGHVLNCVMWTPTDEAVIKQLKDENARLLNDNARLQEVVTDDELHMRKVLEENGELRKLVLDYFNAPCLECNPWTYGLEGCKHCESGNCTLAIRTLELGIELAE